MSKKRPWACDNFKAGEDPYFCARCGDFASMHNGPTPGAPRSVSFSVPLPPMPNDQLANELAEKFLRWQLPDSVCSDPCSAKQGPGRIGANLLSYSEARQMMQEVVTATLNEKGIGL
jgi:hypothetical protein